jgi:hypothetical protein
VGPRTGLDAVEETKFLPLPGLELRPLCPPARSQSLYRLRHPGKCGSGTLYQATTACISVGTPSILAGGFVVFLIPSEQIPGYYFS